MNKPERAKLYMDYLTQEGYRPSLDADGDVDFKAEGGNYYIQIDENDDKFFRLVYPNFWSIDSSQELARVLAAANYATMATKVAKVFVRPDNKNTSASIEMFIDPPENFRSVYGRAMSALRAAIGTFAEKMKGNA